MCKWLGREPKNVKASHYRVFDNRTGGNSVKRNLKSHKWCRRFQRQEAADVREKNAVSCECWGIRRGPADVTFGAQTENGRGFLNTKRSTRKGLLTREMAWRKSDAFFGGQFLQRIYRQTIIPQVLQITPARYYRGTGRVNTKAALPQTNAVYLKSVRWPRRNANKTRS